MVEQTPDLFVRISQSIASAFDSASSIFGQFITGKFLTFFMMMFIVGTFVRLIIKPLVGSSGSDKAKGKANASNEESENTDK